MACHLRSRINCGMWESGEICTGILVISYTEGRWCCWLLPCERRLGMRKPSFLLTSLSEAQRAQALERFTIIRPALEEKVSQAQVAHTHHLPPSPV
jgi:hypothetical protein